MGNVDVNHPSPDLLDTLYLCQQRQDWYRDEDFGIEQRQQLPTWTEALQQFVTRADRLGILVMVSGVVGNNTHRRLDPQEFRGFALSDSWAPLIFINGADTKAAQMFTLAHEIAHLWLGESGVSNIKAVTEASDHSTERWCSQVAAELLVPSDLVRSEFSSGRTLKSEINRLARRFKVSALVFLRRLHDTGKLGRNEFWSAYREEMDRLRQHASSRSGNHYLNVGTRASKRFACSLIASALEGRPSFTESLRLLDIKKMSTFREVAQRLGTRF